MTEPTAVSLAVLNEVHRQRQAMNALEAQRAVMRLFLQLVDPKNIAKSSTPWLTQSISIILRYRSAAILLATAYATAVRRIQVPGAPDFKIPTPPPPRPSQLIRSLTYTGPGKLAVDLAKTPKPVEPLPSEPHELFVEYDRDLKDYEKRVKELPAKAAVMSSAAAYRHVTDGGRDLIDQAVQHDPTAVGYIRICKDHPCAFCLMLASRGPVYKKDSFKESDVRFTGPGKHKVHDACSCMVQPIYGSVSTKNWTDQARQAEQLWIDHAAKFSGRDAINAFARAAREQNIADLTRW